MVAMKRNYVHGKQYGTFNISKASSEWYQQAVQNEKTITAIFNSFCKNISFLLLFLIPICSFSFLFINSLLTLSWFGRLSICVLINFLAYISYSYPFIKWSWERAVGIKSTTWSNRTVICVIVFLILQVYFLATLVYQLTSLSPHEDETTIRTILALAFSQTLFASIATLLLSVSLGWVRFKETLLEARPVIFIIIMVGFTPINLTPTMIDIRHKNYTLSIFDLGSLLISYWITILLLCCPNCLGNPLKTFIVTFPMFIINLYVTCIISIFHISYLETVIYARTLSGRVKFFNLVTLFFILIVIYSVRVSVLSQCTRKFLKKRKPTKANRNTLVYSLVKVLSQISSERDLESTLQGNLQIIDSVLSNLKEQYEYIVVGSFAERFSVPLNAHIGVNAYASHAIFSDCDTMIFPIGENVSFSDDGKSQFRVIESKIPFYRILSNTSEYQPPYILKKKLKEEIKQGCGHYTFVDEEIDGPAIRLKKWKHSNEGFNGMIIEIDADLVFALKCMEWPETVNWVNGRSLNIKWPCEQDIQRIKSYGCHFVAKPHPTDKRFEWRISFSLAELELSKLLPKEARMCFIGIKLIAKDYLSVICPKLKSYHLKMIFLNCMQTRDPALWNEENVEDSFHYLLSKVSNCVEMRNCPNFWFPQINMFNDFNEADFKRLSKKLINIAKKPSKFIELNFQR